MRNGGSEGPCRRRDGIDMNPLVIVRRLREEIDARLIHRHPFGRPQLRADLSGKLGITHLQTHALPPLPGGCMLLRVPFAGTIHE